MSLEATVSLAWVNTVIAAAQRLGVERDSLMVTAGIPAAALDAKRWPIDYITRLWHAAERCTGDPGLGLKTGVGVGPSSINVVGFALQSAATLRQSIALVQKYQSLISDGGRFQMLTGNTATWVVYHPRQGALAFSPHQIEAVLAAVVTFASRVMGLALRPRRVQFSHARLGPLKGYRDVFGCPVEFEQAFSGLQVDNTVLDKYLPQADTQLAKMHEQYTSAQLAALTESHMSAEDLRQWLAVHMGPQVPRRIQAAQALGVSERTLARRLQLYGQTFNGLLDEVRREMALQVMTDTDFALADIALSLGFADSSTFLRAFKRWTGMTPARWRKQHEDKSESHR